MRRGVNKQAERQFSHGDTVQIDKDGADAGSKADEGARSDAVTVPADGAVADEARLISHKLTDPDIPRHLYPRRDTRWRGDVRVVTYEYEYLQGDAETTVVVTETTKRRKEVVQVDDERIVHARPELMAVGEQSRENAPADGARMIKHHELLFDGATQPGR